MNFVYLAIFYYLMILALALYQKVAYFIDVAEK